MREVQDVLDVTGTPRRCKPQTGDTRWDGEVWQRWDSRRWTAASYALHPELLRRPDGYRDAPQLAAERGTNAVEQVVADRVTSYGASVVLTTPTYVVLGHRRRVSNLFHALLTLFTGGLWGLVWLAAFLGAREERTRYEVDLWGNVWAQQVASRPS